LAEIQGTSVSFRPLPEVCDWLLPHPNALVGFQEMRSLISLRRLTVNQLAWSAPMRTLAVAVLSGLLSHAALAATGTTSLLVSTTVEAGCLVSPTAGVSSGPNRVSVSCTLPVAYQVSVVVVPQSPHANIGSTGPDLASLSGGAYTRDLGSLRPQSQPVPAASDAGHGLASLASTLPADSFETVRGPDDGKDSGAVSVTIVY
jgi:hypothetical protein